jgi:hypothetical protein
MNRLNKCVGGEKTAMLQERGREEQNLTITGHSGYSVKKSQRDIEDLSRPLKEADHVKG